MADLKREDILEWVKAAPALELAELVKEMEEVFGVSAAAPVAAAAPAAGEVAAVEEKDSFDVVIASAGGTKIQVIKVVRELDSSLGLKEAKDLVDSAPKAVLTGVNKEKADEAKAKLEEAGATVEVK
ncbi:MAG TPA: 50S ribosomal protein L7/L12 [Coriobacteriia bacterium]|uniref:50S ribosomal protein L7/L12 n=1 Tax=Anaerosoma tenue TaxID=2933588 RepID=UPI00076C8AF7|nr:50S ribosomal protein L7/L12 [Anaerosoma tenue]KUK47876.1 MAG: LSU ribosomal protein L12P [Actinobacteria bacterium 66_15]MCK8115655.1 50S ribosomal protein L7/L12 [Anaerosoma tenue]HAL31254.1 50S ribosomal protein L7/L12 [Coriobacteriia bacterium]